MRGVFFVLACFFCHLNTWSQKEFKTKYPNIPRIDIHSHAGGDVNSVKNYIKVRNRVQSIGNINISNWVNLGNREYPINSIDNIKHATEGRMVFAFGNYIPNDLIKDFESNTIKELKDSGYIGYKLWFGPYQRRLENMPEDTLKYINDERLNSFFLALNTYEIPLTSLHVADPNGVYGSRTPWCADPVDYWSQIRAFEDIVKNNPNLLILVAHGGWLMVQDAQLDYLRYLLASYPNLYIDLAATFQYFNRLNTDNLRDFFINYSDRILFGTDVGVVSNNSVKSVANGYMRCFEILETDNIVQGGFFGNPTIQGLALPEMILENIYYKNAVRLFPILINN